MYTGSLLYVVLETTNYYEKYDPNKHFRPLKLKNTHKLKKDVPTPIIRRMRVFVANKIEKIKQWAQRLEDRMNAIPNANRSIFQKIKYNIAKIIKTISEKLESAIRPWEDKFSRNLKINLNLDEYMENFKKSINATVQQDIDRNKELMKEVFNSYLKRTRERKW